MTDWSWSSCGISIFSINTSQRRSPVSVTLNPLQVRYYQILIQSKEKKSIFTSMKGIFVVWLIVTAIFQFGNCFIFRNVQPLPQYRTRLSTATLKVRLWNFGYSLELIETPLLNLDTRAGNTIINEVGRFIRRLYRV